jgi:flagellar biosynthesis/type III secretory pathway protein FliH
LEVKSMLKENIAKWKKRMRAKARAEARAEAEAEVMARGIAQGRSEGKAEALTSLLAGRFGAIPPSWRKRIQGARLATLERWFKRAIVAPDVTSVFNPRR